MYPGVACTKIIPVNRAKPDNFKETEGESVINLLSVPATNIAETQDDYIIMMGTPGLSREDFQIEFENSLITISAQKSVSHSNYAINRCEYKYDNWTRIFQLPDDADPLLAYAEYINGELIIHIPRSESQENISKTSIYVY